MGHLGGTKRIGVLTGGGDAPGLNAVIRAVTKTAVLEYGWSVLGFQDGFEGVIHDRWVELTLDSVRGILPRGGTMLGASNRCNPFAYAAPGDPEPRDYSATVLERLAQHGLDGLVVIGGDGTMTVAHRLHGLGVPLVGVPKTIDNDVRGTEVTFGFDTAVNTVTDAIDKLHTTAESHHRVMIVEVMGRTAGWIALHAGLAGGADVILIPELPFSLDQIRATIRRRQQLGRHFTIIVVAEGAAPAGGEAIYEQIGPLPYQRRYGGIGEWLRAQLAETIPQEVRCVVLGHLQRGGSPTARDRMLGSVMGAAAVDLIAAGTWGYMVGVSSDLAGHRPHAVIPVPLAEPSRGPRLVPVNHAVLRAAREMGIAFCDGAPKAE
ncbi:MAG: ATP-dependent 6-phosphofructokinase [Sphaerobacter sp.]|nr:ATP-dependent 6-phosphofructokinase [Sphaerobacter sp.]